MFCEGQYRVTVCSYKSLPAGEAEQQTTMIKWTCLKTVTDSEPQGAGWLEESQGIRGDSLSSAQANKASDACLWENHLSSQSSQAFYILSLEHYVHLFYATLRSAAHATFSWRQTAHEGFQIQSIWLIITTWKKNSLVNRLHVWNEPSSPIKASRLQTH